MVVALPPFAGFTRKIVIAAAGIFLFGLVLALISPAAAGLLFNDTMLHPDQALGKFIWQLVTYPFVSVDILQTLFSCIAFWFFGSALESERGRRWFAEYFFTSAIAGAIVACIIARLLGAHVPALFFGTRAYGLWPAVLALTVAFAFYNPEQEITFNFLFRLKAKYLAIISMLVYLALTLTSGHRFDALVSLCVGLAGYAYLRFAPRQGLRFAASERWYGARNAYYRNKRKQAAKKFTVYMKEQGRDVHFDASGKFISPDEEKRDPNSKRWMN